MNFKPVRQDYHIDKYQVINDGTSTAKTVKTVFGIGRQKNLSRWEGANIVIVSGRNKAIHDQLRVAS